MGLFCVNLHFRTADDKAVSAALNRRRANRSIVLPAKGCWTSLYEEEASHQDDGRIRELAGGLSEELHVAAMRSWFTTATSPATGSSITAS